MRLFIASGFSAPVVERICELRSFAGARLGERVKWVEPENIHLTYAFLGEIAAETMLPAIQASMDAAAGGFQRTAVTLGGLGAFPSLERPRVLWLGIGQGAAPLKALALKLYGNLAAEGFIFEHEFSAHITLARVKGRLDAAALASAAAKAGEMDVRDTIVSLDLMESRLSGSGPEYRVIYSRKLL
jgi:2'-5' RNA ligase